MRIEPFVHAPGTEQGRRAGTENVLLEMALGAAWRTGGSACPPPGG
jgi:cysteine sulfinate desulfinase/cysteine desulfurase-like protein